MFFNANPECTTKVISYTVAPTARRPAKHRRPGLALLAYLACARAVLSILVLPLLVPSVGAHAQVQDSRSNEISSLDELPTVELAMARRIALRFQDHPDLTGEYEVGPDATLSVPVIGRLSIAAMSPERLEQVLTERVTEFTGKPTFVTAEIVTYRPIFVTGLVSKPGAVDWYPGLTVLQAEALAGGLYRASEQAGNFRGGVGTVEAMRLLRTGHEQQKRALASLARLRAEQKGAEEIEVPSGLVDLIGEQQAKSVIDGQQSLLDSRRKSLDKQLAALEYGSTLAREEVKGLDEQRVRLEEQLQMRRSMQEKIVKLLERGIVPQERSFEGQIQIADLEERATNVAVARARVQSTAAMLRQEAVVLQIDREASIDAEIAKLEGEMAQATIDVEAAMETYNKVNIEAARTPAASLSRLVLRYAVIRRSEAGEERIMAQTSSYLRPGDVLVVSQEVEQAPSRQNVDGNGDRPGEAK